MNDKKVSVIIPCYNQALFLNEALQSVLEQTHTNWECLIIDDGSTDGSKEIALKYCSLDNRFRYVYQTNAGLSSARNTGLKLSKGDFVQFLDGDDLIKPLKFEKQIIDLQKAQIAVADYFSFLDGNKNEAAPHRYLSPFVSEENFKQAVITDWEYKISIPCHAVLFDRKLQKEHEIFFNETLPNHEDWVFWTQLFHVANTLKNNTSVLALYRIRPDSMSMNYSEMKRGFQLSATILLRYFQAKNEKYLVRVVRDKKNEIKNKNKAPFLKKIQSRLTAKLIHIYKYVINN